VGEGKGEGEKRVWQPHHKRIISPLEKGEQGDFEGLILTADHWFYEPRKDRDLDDDRKALGT